MIIDKLKIEPLSPVLGARVTGLDLAQETPESVKQEMRDAFNKYGVLCFSGQKIEPDDQFRFASVFGRADVGKAGRIIAVDTNPTKCEKPQEAQPLVQKVIHSQCKRQRTMWLSNESTCMARCKKFENNAYPGILIFREKRYCKSL